MSKTATNGRNRVDEYLNPSDTKLANAMGLSAGMETRKYRINLPRRDAMLMTIKGVTPLLAHRMSDRALDQIELKQTGQEVMDKGHRRPHREFREAMYLIHDSIPHVLTDEWQDSFQGEIMSLANAYENRGKDVHGFPVIALYKAMKRSCKYIKGLTMADAPATFTVNNDGSSDPLLSELSYETCIMRRDRVCLPNGITVPAYRPMYTGWAMRVVIEFSSDMITAERLVSVVARAGSVGVGAWRPECDGIFGKFTIDPDSVTLFESRKAESGNGKAKK